MKALEMVEKLIRLLEIHGSSIDVMTEFELEPGFGNKIYDVRFEKEVECVDEFGNDCIKDSVLIAYE